MSLTRSLAHRLVRLYPRAWRERYGDEVLALMEDDAVGVGTIVEFLIALTTEWAHALTGWRPGERTRLTLGGLADMTALYVAGALLALAAVPIAGWVHAAEPGFSISPLGWPFAVYILAPIRMCFTMMAYGAGGALPRWAIGRVELSLWLVAAFLSSFAVALFHLNASGNSHGEAWWVIALRGSSVQLLALSTKRQFRRAHRTRELLEAAKRARREVPHNILGLGPHA